MSNYQDLRGNVKEFRRGGAPDKVAGVLGVLAALVFPMTRNNQPDSESLASSVVQSLPLQDYLSGQALFAVGILLMFIPIFGCKSLGEKIEPKRGGLIAALVSGFIINLVVWFQYFSY